MSYCVWYFFLTNIHGLPVLLGPFLLLASYSQLLPHVSSVFGLEIKGSFYHTSKQKEKSNLQTNSPLELSKLPSVSQPQAMDEDAYCWRSGLPSPGRALPRPWYSWGHRREGVQTKGGGEGKGRCAIRGGHKQLLLEAQRKLPLMCNSHPTGFRWDGMLSSQSQPQCWEVHLSAMLKSKGTLLAELASWTEYSLGNSWKPGRYCPWFSLFICLTSEQEPHCGVDPLFRASDMGGNAMQTKYKIKGGRILEEEASCKPISKSTFHGVSCPRIQRPNMKLRVLLTYGIWIFMSIRKCFSMWPGNILSL